MNSGHYQHDVWSSVDGVTWVQATASAAPLADGRTLHQVFSHDGKMWIVGGQTLDDLPSAPASPASTKAGSPYYDDVWSSTDGATWTLVSSGNAWAPRGLIMGSPVKDGYMWLVGGGAYDTDGNPRVYRNDVWRSADGITWTQVTADGGFVARQYNGVAVLNGELVMVAGYGGPGNLNDALASADGVTWRVLAQNVVPLWEARHAHALAEYNGELVMTGGPLGNTIVWALS